VQVWDIYRDNIIHASMERGRSDGLCNLFWGHADRLEGEGTTGKRLGEEEASEEEHESQHTDKRLTGRQAWHAFVST